MKNLMFTMLVGGLWLILMSAGCESENGSTTSTEAKITTTEDVKTVVEEKMAVNGVSVGDMAPDFRLKATDGKMYSLADIMDANGKPAKGYIITFTCNTCPYAVMYEDRLIDLHNKYAPMGYPVVAIMPNSIAIKPGDSFDNMQKRVADKGFPFLYLDDSAQKVYPEYGAAKTPHIYLLDSDKKVRYVGAIDDNHNDPSAVTKRYVEDAIKALEKGEEPSPSFTKAVGCSIKA